MLRELKMDTGARKLERKTNTCNEVCSIVVGETSPRGFTVMKLRLGHPGPIIDNITQAHGGDHVEQLFNRTAMSSKVRMPQTRKYPEYSSWSMPFPDTANLSYMKQTVEIELSAKDGESGM